MKKFIPILTTLICLTIGNCALADSLARPRSYTKVTENGQYVFVMLVEDSEPLFGSSGKQYLSSGLYQNYGTNTLLWTVDWFAFNVYVSSDGKHLVRMGSCADLNNKREPNLKELAVAFYENGKLLKEYLIYDLIHDPKRLSLSVSHFAWKKDVVFNDNIDRLTIITLDDQQYVFDIKSGEIVLGKSPNHYINQYSIAVFLIVVLSIIAIIIIAKLRKKKTKNVA